MYNIYIYKRCLLKLEFIQKKKKKKREKKRLFLLVFNVCPTRSM